MARIQHAGTEYPFEFRGRGGEYFKIWIVNVLLSILTLYIYSAWAKVRTKRYFYGNTYVNDASFEYHATPIQILKGRIIAVILLAVYVLLSIYSAELSAILAVILLLLTPWIISRSIRFNARMSSHRNVRFGFTGKARTLYLYLLVYPILIFALVGALIFGLNYLSLDTRIIAAVSILAVILGFFWFIPWIQKSLASYQVNHLKYGTANFSADLKTFKFSAIAFKSLLVWLLVILLLFVFAGIAVVAISAASGIELPDLLLALQQDPSAAEDIFASINPKALIAMAVLFYILFLASIMLITAYQQSRVRNYVFNVASIDNRISLSSTVKLFPLFWLFLSNLLILIFTLGLGYPWIKVRTARFFANNTSLYSEVGLDGFLSDQAEKQSSLMEELGDAFDTGLDLGL